MARETREIWVERINRWKQSGQSAKTFAEANGLNVWTLRGWGARLRRAEEARGKRRPAARSAVASTRKRSQGLPFVELIASAPMESRDDRFEIWLGDSRSIRVPSGFDADSLRRLLDVVTAR